ncbi:uncharacterized protein LOC111796447 isoform X2 [Cucurbita pepo subsp. pepo]|uniref:uncharacterized protein LOC111796447 isoform X2 n=1 Tax=Cucurbita pepo subsp. pepo TaxID=3664 RepID=UPI000C9D5B3C|nr:uncharacterized protein LOC111796447 isoform X2 [Cucurbita pepo subsp. pepo]
MEQRKNVAILPIQMFDPFIDLHMILIIIGPCGNCHCSLFTRLYVKETKEGGELICSLENRGFLNSAGEELQNADLQVLFSAVKHYSSGCLLFKTI